MSNEPSDSLSNDLRQNLRFLCASKPSVALVCREIGINQQQFSKYLTGRARPSPHNLRRIARHFDVEETVLSGPHKALLDLYRKKADSLATRRQDPLAQAFPGDLAKLRPYLGAYQIFFRAPVSPEDIIVNAVFLDERNGMVYSRLVEVIPDGSGRPRWTRCDGKVAFREGRVFMVDAERRNEDALSLYILSPPPRQKKTYLFGTMCYLASMPHRIPCASKVVWKKFDSFRSVRELFETCGVYPSDSLKLDPFTRNYLLDDTAEPLAAI
ncbi:MAG: helix-turn-helix transcriptional regulator [Pseudomonadota bacterium]